MRQRAHHAATQRAFLCSDAGAVMKAAAAGAAGGASSFSCLPRVVRVMTTHMTYIMQAAVWLDGNVGGRNVRVATCTTLYL